MSRKITDETRIESNKSIVPGMWSSHKNPLTHNTLNMSCWTGNKSAYNIPWETVDVHDRRVHNHEVTKNVTFTWMASNKKGWFSYKAIPFLFWWNTHGCFPSHVVEVCFLFLLSEIIVLKRGIRYNYYFVIQSISFAN